MKIQNTKIKLVTVLASLIMGLVLISPTAILPNVSATYSIPHIAYSEPILSSTDSQAISNAALSVPALQNWSRDWQYVHMAYLGNNKAGTPDFKWQYAIVDLKASSNSAPFACDIDWWAQVTIDMTTKKVVSASYPTMESHACHAAEGKLSDPPGWSVATENDLNSTTNYYGDYAELNIPSFSNSIYSHLNGKYVEQFVNSFFHPSSGCSDGNCIEQAGWILASTTTCHSCNTNSNDLIYVDESVHNNQDDYNTGLVWTSSLTTLYGEIDCAYTLADYGIYITNGTNTFLETTTIPCSTTQLKTDLTDNSVFFENADTQASSNWSSYITGTVSATNALEFTGSSTNHAWNTSHNVDVDCHYTISKDVVMTGSLASGTTATWSSLSKQPVAC